jgi:AsmA protein
MNKTLRNILVGLGTLFVLALVVVLGLPFVIPLDSYKGRIETAAGHATGREFRISGPMRVMFFPHLGVRAQQVTLANVPGGRAAIMASVGDIDISVKLLPLLTGRVAVDRIVLDKPTIALEVGPDGNANWKFGQATGKSKTGTLTLPEGTEFSGLTISDGRITYDNAKTGTHRALEHVNVDVALTTTDKPVSVKGDFALVGRKVEFEARLATLKTFLGSGTTTLQSSARSELMQTSFKGVMAPDGATDGRFQLSTSSFRDLAAWLGEPLPGGGFGAMTLSSRVWNKEKLTRLDDLRVTLDRQNISGHLQVDSRGKVPVLDGALDADHLDFTPYMMSGPHEAEKAEQGWSRKPIDVAIVKTFSGRLTVTTGALRMRGLHLGKTALRIDDESGVLTAWLDPITLYGGMGQAQFVVDARGRIPSFHTVLNFRGVALRPFLTDTMGLDSIEGGGALSLDVVASGDSADAIMHTLAGKGSISGANGRVRGVDLGQVTRTVQTFLGSGATGDNASTDFHAMGGSFTIARGVLTNSDFKLNGPVVQMTGNGQLDIGNRTIDLRLKPVAGMAGYSLSVPFRIGGTWDHVRYTPDLAGIIGGVMDSLTHGGEGLKGLFGGQQQTKQPDGQKKKSNPLKDLFGLH